MAITRIEPYIVNSSANFTFAGVTANGNLSVTGVSNLGPVGNVIITGGSNGQVLTTNGAGNLSWTTVTGGGGGAAISNGNSNVNIPAANGNITVSVAGNANLATFTGTGVNVSGTLNVTGNANVGNIGATGVVATTVSGSLTTAAQPNVTSVGTLTSLDVSGNVSAGNANLGNNVSANFFTGNGVYLTGITTSGVSNGNSNVNIPAANGNVNISVAGNANVLVVTGTGANVTGTANVTGNIAGGGNLNIAGNAVFGGNLTVDGNLVYVNVTDLSVEDPIIQLQTGPNAAPPTSNTGKDVGVALNYYDTSAKIAWMGWDVSNAEIAFGANVGISSEVVSFTSLANIRSGNAQLGNLATANFVAGTLTTASQPNITTIGTLSSLSVTGNVTAGNANLGNTVSANFFTGNGSLLTGITINNLSNGNSNVNIPAANGNVNISSAGNANILVVTGTGANVAGYGTFTGNVTAGNFIAGGGTGGNLTGANVISANTMNVSAGLNVTGVSNLGPIGNVIITGGSNGQVLTTNGSGNLSWTSISTSSIGNGNSNVSIPAANGNVTVSAAGNANILVVTGTGVNVAGTGNFSGNFEAANASLGNLASANFIQGVLTTASQPNITSVGTLGSLTTTGNVSVGGNLTVTAKSNLGPVGNVVITGGTANYVLSTDGAGNLSWVAQSGGGGGANISNGNSNVSIATANGNITMSAVGNANIMTVTGTGIVVSGTANLGSNGNVIITGGSNGQVLTTDGSGNLTWTTVASGNTGNVLVQTFSGTGSQTVFTLSSTPTSEDYIWVNIDGVLQLHNAYTLSGNSLTLSAAPVNGASIEVQTVNLGSGGGGGGGGGGTYSTTTFTANGVQNTASVTSGMTVNSVIVTFDGVVQTPTTDYTISGTTLTFTTAPEANLLVQIRELAAGGGGGSALVIKDEGSNIATAATSIDFVGDSITANATSNAVTVTVNTRARITGYSLIFGG
jgi:hypothetical protein